MPMPSLAKKKAALEAFEQLVADPASEDDTVAAALAKLEAMGVGSTARRMMELRSPRYNPRRRPGAEPAPAADKGPPTLALSGEEMSDEEAEALAAELNRTMDAQREADGLDPIEEES